MANSPSSRSCTRVPIEPTTIPIALALRHCCHCSPGGTGSVPALTDLRRPWCLLELYMAVLLSLPIVVLEVVNAGDREAGFDWAAADALLVDLPRALESEERKLLEDEVASLG